MLRGLPSLVLLLSLVACNPASSSESPKDAQTSSLPDRDPGLACAKAKEGGVVLDVRTPGEFEGGHVKGAVNIPVDALGSELDRVEKLTGGDKDKPLILYCKSGRRADRAKDELLGAGYTQVTNVGGLSDWPDDCTM